MAQHFFEGDPPPDPHPPGKLSVGAHEEGTSLVWNLDNNFIGISKDRRKRENARKIKKPILSTH